jgi:hypothetical protein
VGLAGLEYETRCPRGIRSATHAHTHMHVYAPYLRTDGLVKK